MSHTAKILCAGLCVAVSIGVIPRLTPRSRGQAPPKSPAKQGLAPSSAPETNGKKPPPSDGRAAPANASEPSAEDAILQKLQEPTEFSFKELPLKDALAAISKKHKLT